MTFKKRLLMILALALIAGGLYGAGRLGLAVLPQAAVSYTHLTLPTTF